MAGPRDASFNRVEQNRRVFIPMLTLKSLKGKAQNKPAAVPVEHTTRLKYKYSRFSKNMLFLKKTSASYPY